MKTPFSFFKILSLALALFATPFAMVSAEPVAVANKSDYPLSICVVSGDKLGQMGTPVILEYQGTEVRFCCKDCIKDFQKDPEKYLKRLHDATPSTVDKNTPLPAEPTTPKA